MTPLKIMAGTTAAFTLLLTFAVTRIPPALPAAVPSETFDDVWAELMNPPLPKADRIMIAATDPKPVVTQRIMPDVPGDVSPAAAPLSEDKPKVQRRRHVESDVCTRHRMHKVWTHNRKKWNCRQ